MVQHFSAKLRQLFFFDADHKPRTSMLVRDITERKMAQESLEHRLMFEEIMAKISTYFVGNIPFDESINYALGEIGKIMHATSASVFMFDKNRASISNTHEWCAEGVTPKKNICKISQLKFFLGGCKNLVKANQLL